MSAFDGKKTIDTVPHKRGHTRNGLLCESAIKATDYQTIKIFTRLFLVAIRRMLLQCRRPLLPTDPPERQHVPKQVDGIKIVQIPYGLGLKRDDKRKAIT